MSKRDVLLAKHNFSELKSLANKCQNQILARFPLFKGIFKCIWLLYIINLNSCFVFFKQTSNGCIHLYIKMNKTHQETFETISEKTMTIRRGDFFFMCQAFLTSHYVYDFYGSDCVSETALERIEVFFLFPFHFTPSNTLILITVNYASRSVNVWSSERLVGQEKQSCSSMYQRLQIMGHV